MFDMDPIEFLQLTYPHVYYPIATIWWLAGCYFAYKSKKESVYYERKEDVLDILFWMTLTAVIWPITIYCVVSLVALFATAFCAWVLISHIFLSIICFPYFVLTGYDEYLLRLSNTVPWNYYKIIKHNNGAREWVDLKTGNTVKIKYNTGDKIWIYKGTWRLKYTFVDKIKTHDGFVYRYDR